ncbi:MAPEG family protein [Pacificimonas sp. WHA3]|uniref:MAPEG family protein n=1 Tax=Pacificimonas pallii TaxID=2827236 RepID=A0ABS6SBA2_9SPHN|nr:MAPEG family protein [Pacificimonas pallii]MBV7255695.1 MAPEG family protein [Pacificimonas pallii]
MLTVTLATAAVLGLYFWLLSLRVVQGRIGGKVLIGDGESEDLLYRVRAHANFAEHVPLILILMGLIELAVGPRTGLIVIAAVLVLARVLHGWGMTMYSENKPRVIGVLLTWAVLLTLASWGLLLAFGVVG